jgi:small subunit ribosomal protein S1
MGRACRKITPGSVVKGKVKNLTDFGLFIGIGDGIDGLVHLSEISWSRRKDAAAKTYKKGATVEALVLNVDKEHKRFSLSLKQMKKNPWEGLSERYHVGDIVDGYVTSITDFGIFVEIEDGVEGLVHISELDEQKGKHPSELFKIDDKIRVIILNIDEREKRIGLSIKALKRQEDEKVWKSFQGQKGHYQPLGMSLSH